VSAIAEEKNINQVGLRLMKFCGLYDLKKIGEQAQSYAEPLNARYIIKHATTKKIVEAQ
jgi:hypothetical protein